MKTGLLPLQKPADCEAMAGYSNRVLAKRFDLFIQKDEAYYERLIREQESEDGHVVILRDAHNRMKFVVCSVSTGNAVWRSGNRSWRIAVQKQYIRL